MALYDSVEKIAGLLHIVLSGNRVRERHDDRNAFYADTGVPLLVREMEKLGAEAARMTAIISGGACMTSGCNPDIGLDNIERSLSLLAGAGIQVIRQETGGDVGRAVEISVNTGETRIRTNSRSRTEYPVGKPDRPLPLSLLNDLVASLERMRPDKLIAGKLFDAIHQSEIDWHEVAALVSQDIVLALHLFQKCNSGYYGNPQKVASFEAALIWLGPDKLRRVCVVAAAGKNSAALLADFGIDQKTISRHGLASAITAQHLALVICPELEKEAFTAALFHSIGGIAARMTTADNLPGPDEICNGCCIFDDENDSGPAQYHRLLAAALLEKWDFPQIIVEAASSIRSMPIVQNEINIATIVATACRVSTMLGIGGSGVNQNTRFSLSVLEQTRVLKDNDRLLPDIILKLRAAGLLK